MPVITIFQYFHFNFLVLCTNYCVSSSWFLLSPLLHPNLFFVISSNHSVLRFEFQNNADVLAEGEALLMCIEVRRRAVLHLNAECTRWLCRDFRIKRNLLHILSLSSPGPVFLGHFHDVVFKRGSHENVQDWVEAAVK